MSETFRVIGIQLRPLPRAHTSSFTSSLPIGSREEIMNSPMDATGATSGFTALPNSHRPASPVMDDPSAELERELAGTHLRQGR